MHVDIESGQFSPPKYNSFFIFLLQKTELKDSPFHWPLLMGVGNIYTCWCSQGTLRIDSKLQACKVVIFRAQPSHASLTKVLENLLISVDQMTFFSIWKCICTIKENNILDKIFPSQNKILANISENIKLSFTMFIIWGHGALPGGTLQYMGGSEIVVLLLSSGAGDYWATPLVLGDRSGLHVVLRLYWYYGM